MKLRCYAKWPFQLGMLMPAVGRFAITIQIIEAPSAALQRTIQVRAGLMRILEISCLDKSIVQIGVGCFVNAILNGLDQNYI
jgi:hypothetical protein